MLRDRNIEWLRVHKYIHWSQMELFVAAAVLGSAAMTAASTALVSAINSTVLYGIVATTEDQLAGGQLLIPFDMDPSFQLKFRVHYVGESTTATDTFTWKVLLSNLKRAATLATPATALDTAIAAHVPGITTAYQPNVTGWGVLNADTWTRAEVEAGYLLGYTVSASVATVHVALALLGLEYSYVPMRTRGTGPTRDLDAAA